MNGIHGIILAGGRATRMGGGDKGLRKLAGRSILARVADRLAPQVDVLALNANGDADRFAPLGMPIVPDTLPDHPGPLAGILAGLEWASARGARQLATAATDSPFFPADLVGRLASAGESRIAMARCGGRVHPVFALWPAGVAGAMAAFLASGQKASVLRFAETLAHTFVDFDMLRVAAAEIDPFFNVNTPEDLETAERIAADLPS